MSVKESKGQEEADSPKVKEGAAVDAPLIDSVNIRSMALVILTSIATLYFINWAQAVLLPLVVAVLISYALDPLVSGLAHLKIPRPLSAAIILALLVAAIGGATSPLQQEAMAMLDKIPLAIDEFQRKQANVQKGEDSLMEKAQAAAEKIEDSTASDQSDKGMVTPVRVIDKPMNIQDYALQGAPAVLVFISQCFTVLLLVYFLLSVGRLYKRKVVKISGPSFANMRKATKIMNEFHHQVRRFLFVMLLGGLFVGIVTWLVFLALGLEQALLWGVIAGVASGIPYLGPFLVLAGSGLAAFVQFGDLNMAAIVGGTSLIITSIQGNLLTPWLTSQVSSLNAVAIFIGLIFWGWLWGPVGLIIATPLLMIIKSLCDHVVNLQPVGEFLGK